MDYLKEILPLDTFEAFLRGSISNKTAFCLGEKEGMLVNNKRNSWYNRVRDFIASVWDRRKEIFIWQVDQHARPDRTTPLQSA